MREKEGMEQVCGVEKRSEKGDFEERKISGNQESKAFRLLGNIRKEIFFEK